MTRVSERGSTLIWWVIILVIFFVIAAVLAYTQLQEKDRFIEENTRLRAEIEKRKNEVSDKAIEINSLSKKVGWVDTTSAAGVSNGTLVDDRLKLLREKYSSHIGASDVTLEAAIRGLEAAHDERVNQLNDLKSQLAVAQADAEKAKEATRQVTSEKDQEIAKLTASVKEGQDRADRGTQENTRTIDGLRNRITELEGVVQKGDSDRKKEKNDLENRVLAEQAKVLQINERNRLTREHDVPDGWVLEASQSVGLAWIDLGARHGLVRGTKFQVFELGKGGEKHPKGWLEVRELRDDWALCGITHNEDSLRPIVAGDLIANPYFDREKRPVFVFLGDLPGRFSKDEVRRVLQSKGAKVDDTVTAMTDFLVVGVPPKSETPVVLEDTAAFLLAREYGVQMLSANDLQKYIEY